MPAGSVFGVGRVRCRSTAPRVAGTIALLALAAPTPTAGQLDAPAFRRLGTEDGLSQRTPVTIVQDQVGFLWVGTQAGLNRYDGREVRSYHATAGDSASLPDDFIRSLLVTGNGALWVGTESGGIVRYDAVGDRFVRLDTPTPDLGASADSAGRAEDVRALRELGGLIWASTGAGLMAFDPETGTAMWPAVDDPPPSPCPALATSPDGMLILGCEDGGLRFLRRSPDGRRLTTKARIDLGASVTAIHHAGDSILVGTWGGGAHVVAASGDRARPLPLGFRTGDQGSVVLAITIDRADHVWIGTLGGLAELPPHGRTRHHTAVARDPSSLSHPQVQALFEDRAGVLWVGTFDGLDALGPHRYAIRRYTSVQTGRGLLSSPGVVAIDRTAEGAVWLGMMGGDVNRVDFDSGAVASFRPDATPPGTTGADVMSIDADDEGNAWATVWGKGVARIDGSTGDVRRIFPGNGPLAGLQDALAIRVGSDDCIWVGTARTGLFRIMKSDLSVTHYLGAGGDSPLHSGYVWPIREPEPGVLWIASVGARGGVHRLTKNDGARSWYFDPTDPGGLSHGRVLTLMNASDGTVWIGTYQGLNHLDPETGEVTVYRAADGLPHDIVEGILEDDRGLIWISTDSGLARLDPESGEIRAFHAAAGLQGDMFYANSAFEDTDGRLYFGGPSGLNVIDPRAFDDDPSPPTVALTGFSVFGEHRPLGSWAHAEGALELGPDEDFFSFSFAALDFTDPGHNRYRHMLEGLDAGWVDDGTEGSASYTSVPPGGYTLVVSSANGEGVWNERALEIPLIVHPPYYGTWWFRTGAALLLAGMLFGAYALRMHQLERLAAVRRRIAGELHDDIGANLSAIAMKSELVQRSLRAESGDRKRLRDIERMARETTEKVREMIWVVRDEHDTLEGLVDHMTTSATTLLSGVVECDFRAAPDIPDLPIRMEVRQDVFSLYKEALQNVMKHAEATRVDIDVRHADDHLVIGIRDDGRGFDPETVSRGNGLDLMSTRAEKHRADLTLESAPGRGTRVELKIRLV